MMPMRSPPAATPGRRHTRKRRAPVPTIPAVDHRVIMAQRLDTMADVELQHGHHHAAEHLAWRAAALRQAAR